MENKMPKSFKGELERNTTPTAYEGFPPPVFMPEAHDDENSEAVMSLRFRVARAVVNGIRAFADAYKGYRGFDQSFPPKDRPAFPEK